MDEEVIPDVIYVFSNRSLKEADVFEKSSEFCDHPFKNYSLEQVLDEVKRVFGVHSKMPTIVFWNLSNDISEGSNNSVVKRHEHLFEIEGFNKELFEKYLNGLLMVS